MPKIPKKTFTRIIKAVKARNQTSTNPNPDTHDRTSPVSHDRTSPATHDLTSPVTHDRTSPVSHDRTSPASHDRTSSVTLDDVNMLNDVPDIDPEEDFPDDSGIQNVVSDATSTLSELDIFLLHYKFKYNLSWPAIITLGNAFKVNSEIPVQKYKIFILSVL